MLKFAIGFHAQKDDNREVRRPYWGFNYVTFRYLR